MDSAVLAAMELRSFNSSAENKTNMSEFDEEALLTSRLGERYLPTGTLLVLTIIYSGIFMSGVLGNLFTCIVIFKNRGMHTATNYYLFSLAISDVVTLLLALPPDLYSIWEAYPWRFGEVFCIVKSFISEMTAYASILTITAFTIERYVAICHPMRFKSLSSLSRAIKLIFCIWLLACCCALPFPMYTRLFYFAHNNLTGEPVPDSLVCGFPSHWREATTIMLQISTFVFFASPMTVITVLYILIGYTLHTSEITGTKTERKHNPTTIAAGKARKAVLKMLVAVVIAFFVCWAPFHTQRLMTIYIKQHQWTPELLSIQTIIFYLSGVLYFVSSTVNPILYNVMSKKYRKAFKRTLCRCFGKDQLYKDVSFFGSNSPTVKRKNNCRDVAFNRVSNRGTGRDSDTVNTSL